MLSKAAIALAYAGLFCVCSSGCSGDVEQAKREYVQRGDAYIAAGNVDAAVIEYRNAVQQDARFGEAYRKLSAAYVSRGDSANAMRASVAAADLLPDLPEVQVEAGNLLLAAGRLDEAKARAKRVLARDPENVVARVLLGNATAGLKEFDAAMKEFEEAIRLDPQQTSAYASLGILQATQGDRQAAEGTFKQSIALAPTSVPARLALAQFYWSDRQFDRAEEVMKAAVALAPADQRANVSLAVFYEFTGRSAESEPYLKAAFNADPTPRVTLLLADYYLTAKRTGDATPLLRRIVADPKLGVFASIRLANVSELEGRTEEATRTIEDALAAHPGNGGVLAAKADLLRGRHQLDEALKTADLAIAADPASAQAVFVRGRVLAAKGHFAEARKAFEDVLVLNPRAAAADLELARLRLRDRAPEAVTLAAKAAQANPSSLDARLTLARAQAQQHNYAEAKSVLAQLAKAEPKAAAPHAQMGSLLLLTRDADGARAAFNRAIALDPFQTEAIAGLTTLDFKAQRSADALTRLNGLLDRAPNHAGVLLIAAGAYSSTHDLARAETLLVRAIDADPGLLAAYAMLGRVYLAQHRLDAARAQFEKLANEQERPVGALTLLGVINQMQNRIPEAQRAFERALKADPRAAVAANNLAWIYAENGGSLDDALRLAEMANTSLPNQAEVSDTLGWVYYRKDLLPLAIRTLGRGLELDPANATTLYHLALAHEKSGNQVEARRLLERYLTLDPASERGGDVRRRLKVLSTQAGSAPTRTAS
jgi:tetratricopeptide (TPR) repeat protein